MSTLTLPFHTRGRDGHLRIAVHANTDPYATGHHQIAKNFDAERFKGFPVLTASVSFPAEEPAGGLGWVQLIRHLQRGEVIDEEIDTNPLLTGSPLYVEGYHPTFADAPSKPGSSRPRLGCRCLLRPYPPQTPDADRWLHLGLPPISR